MGVWMGWEREVVGTAGRPIQGLQLRLGKQRQGWVSEDVVTALGAPYKVAVLVDDTRRAVALRPGCGEEGEYRLSRRVGGRQAAVTIRDVLLKLGVTEPCVLEGRIEGELVVFEVPS